MLEAVVEVKASGAGAVMSPSGLYRYLLWRSWADGPRIAWLMLNPSTADGCKDDATIRKCIGFSQRWKFGSMLVVNLFAWRATDPGQLLQVPEAAGPENDRYIHAAAESCNTMVAAWGAHPAARRRSDRVMALLAGRQLLCLGLTKGGAPRHPLMLAYATPLEFGPCGFPVMS